MQLDSLDHKILYHLDHDARATSSTIARKVSRGRDTVEYRIQRLRKAGVISSTHAMVNPASLGLTLYKTYLRVRNDRSRIHSFCTDMVNDPRVFAIIECHGQWDFIFTLPAKSPYEFSQLQEEVLQSIQDLLIESSVFVITEWFVFRKKYLLSSGTHWFRMGGLPKVLETDATERGLLQQLTQDARSSSVALAEALDTTPAVVQHRMKRLRESEIIIGYRTRIEPHLLGMSIFKCQIYTNETCAEQTQRFTQVCSAHPNVTAIIHQIGSCHLEIEVQAENYPRFSQVVAELRASFQSFIANMASIMVASEHYKYHALTL